MFALTVAVQSDDVDEHLTMAELYNVMDLLEIPERDTTRWHAAPDDFLEDQIGTRFLTNNVTEEMQSSNVPPSVSPLCPVPLTAP